MKSCPVALVTCMSFCMFFAISPAKGGDLAAAEVLFQKGRTAMQAGDYETARANFAESYRLDTAVGTVMNLAVCEEELGLLANAWEHWQHALRALAPDDRRRQFVEERIAALETDLPMLTIVVRAVDTQGIELERDGVSLGKVSWGVAVPVDPGLHEVTVKSPRHLPRTYQVEVSKGEAKTVEVTTGPPLPKLKPEANPVNAQRTWGYAIGAVGLAGLSSTLATGLMLQGTKNTVDENCPNSECNPEGMKAVNRGKTLLALNTAGFIVAGAGLGTGGALLLFSSRAEKNSEKRASRERKAGSRASLHVIRAGAILTYKGAF